jgi:DNA-binding MarR family transcriptional regulator
MDGSREVRLFELADVILALGRHIEAAKQTEEDGASALHGAVLRHVDRNPGATVGDVAQATRMISSNVSRAIRSLEEAGFLRRVVDERDARRVRLYPTDKAGENLRRLRDAWSRLLDGTVGDDVQIEALTSTLRRIEAELIRSPVDDPRTTP